MIGCAAVGSGGSSSGSGSGSDCRACTNPDSPDCGGCLGGPGTPDPVGQTPAATPDQIAVAEDVLRFGIIGDTRPAVVNDTAAYPSAVITQIFQDLQAENPRPGFAVGTGDYQFSSNGSSTTSPQLDKYLAARANFSNPEYPAMGNHECTGATVSNCGPGTSNGTTSIYTTFLSKILQPLGINNPYYSLLIKPSNNAWSAKVVFVAANAWTSTQATWLDTVLAQPTTYTFIVRHESSQANTAPGVTPSGQIIASHPYTMLIVGHDHTYKRMSQKEVLVGNGGAPLTTGSQYGYGIVAQRSDGSVQFTFYQYKTHAVLDSFAVNADGSPATGNPPPPPPPPTATFSLAASPAAVTSNAATATTSISLTALSGFSGSAALSVSGAPSGATASLASSSLSSGQSTTLTLAPGIASAGTYSVLVSGTSGTETETTNVAWTIGAGASCAHDLCTSGGKLSSTCDPCVTQICSHDSYCCTTGWSSICVGEVASVCGQSTCSGSGSGSGNSCAHAECTTGAKLTSGCDSCVSQICTTDSWCCTHSWDATCVAEVGTICGETCN
jgi:hypothetical protein